MCDKAYQVLHDPSRHWRDAPIEWRRAYAVARISPGVAVR